MRAILIRALLAGSMGVSVAAHGAVISFEATDFVVAPTFSQVRTFDFSIDIVGPLSAGASYNNPALNTVVYSVFGTLDGTPSGFRAFNLQRTVSDAEFTAQGSSMSFAISSQADLADGLQVSELEAAAGSPVFVFNAREVGTGRYHPALVELYADGSGSIRNSNNQGGINPVSNMVVDVDFGEEYITALSFDPSTLTLASASVVPIPAAAWLFGSALLGLGGLSGKTPRKRGV